MWPLRRFWARRSLVCHSAAGDTGLCDDAGVQQGYLPHGSSHPESEAAEMFQRKTGVCDSFYEIYRAGAAGVHGAPGVRTIDEMVGRTDLLKVKENPQNPHGASLDLRAILDHPYTAKDNIRGTYDFELEKTLDETVLMKKLGAKLEKGQPGEVSLKVGNTDRTFGTIFGSEITRRYPEGLPEDTYRIRCGGTGGQSFGAFIPRGMTLELAGDTNDYFGKGLSGGQLIVYPPKEATYAAGENMIVGNVALYGATSGKAFICGMAGERFCVRNSGATVVVEGVGEHGCEYMTGGVAWFWEKPGKTSRLA